jgi:hypothetical protein
MPVFELNQPVTTQEPQVTVDPGLLSGFHTFTLMVFDDDGNQAVDTVVVEIVRRPQNGGSGP